MKISLPPSEKFTSICNWCKEHHTITDVPDEWICACKRRFRVEAAPHMRFGTRELVWNFVKQEWIELRQPPRPASGEKHLVIDPTTGKPWRGRES